MKPKTLMYITFAVLFTTLLLPFELSAQHMRYKLIDLGTFRGPTSFVQAGLQILNERGNIAYCADTPLLDTDHLNSTFLPSPPAPIDPNIFHAFEWDKGVLMDLGALQGPNSSCANWITDNGLIAGLSENGAIDPLLGVPEVRAILWIDRKPINLGTLVGGHESFAGGVNSHGQVAGIATKAVPDPFFGTQVRAFLWQDGAMQDLGTLNAGPDSLTFVAPNESGQVVGCSFVNSTANPLTGIPTAHPFLWEKGEMTDLGTLGGTNACASLINNHGQVMGTSTLKGDEVIHGFLWERGTLTDIGDLFAGDDELWWMNSVGDIVGSSQYPGGFPRHGFLWRFGGVIQDLGTLYPSCNSIITGSVAYSINSKTQIVGSSFCLQPAAQDAVLWENGETLFDLNDLIPANSDLHLVNAFSINERGEITGVGVLPNGDPHAFLLIPCGQGTEGCGGAAESTSAVNQNRPATNFSKSPVPQLRKTPNDVMAAWRARLAQR